MPKYGENGFIEKAKKELFQFEQGKEKDFEIRKTKTFTEGNINKLNNTPDNTDFDVVPKEKIRRKPVLNDNKAGSGEFSLEKKFDLLNDNDDEELELIRSMADELYNKKSEEKKGKGTKEQKKEKSVEEQEEEHVEELTKLSELNYACDTYLHKRYRRLPDETQNPRKLYSFCRRWRNIIKLRRQVRQSIADKTKEIEEFAEKNNLDHIAADKDNMEFEERFRELRDKKANKREETKKEEQKDNPHINEEQDELELKENEQKDSELKNDEDIKGSEQKEREEEQENKDDEEIKKEAERLKEEEIREKEIRNRQFQNVQDEELKRKEQERKEKELKEKKRKEEEEKNKREEELKRQKEEEKKRKEEEEKNKREEEKRQKEEEKKRKEEEEKNKREEEKRQKEENERKQKEQEEKNRREAEEEERKKEEEENKQDNKEKNKDQENENKNENKNEEEFSGFVLVDEDKINAKLNEAEKDKVQNDKKKASDRKKARELKEKQEKDKKEKKEAEAKLKKEKEETRKAIKEALKKSKEKPVQKTEKEADVFVVVEEDEINKLLNKEELEEVKKDKEKAAERKRNRELKEQQDVPLNMDEYVIPDEESIAALQRENKQENKQENKEEKPLTEKEKKQLKREEERKKRAEEQKKLREEKAAKREKERKEREKQKAERAEKLKKEREEKEKNKAQKDKDKNKKKDNKTENKTDNKSKNKNEERTVEQNNIIQQAVNEEILNENVHYIPGTRIRLNNDVKEYTENKKTLYESFLKGQKVPEFKNREEAVTYRNKNSHFVENEYGSAWNEQVNKQVANAVDWLIDYYKIADTSIEKETEEVKLEIPKYNYTIPNIDEFKNKYESQGSNNCYCCSGTASYNQFVRNEIKKGRKLSDKKETNQKDIRAYVPAFADYKIMKQFVCKTFGYRENDPEAEKEARKRYDQYKNEILSYAGKNKKTVGSVYELADFFISKQNDIAMHRMLMQIPSANYKRKDGKNVKFNKKEKQRADLRYNNVKACFLNKVHEVLQTGNTVTIVGKLCGSMKHYLTIYGIEGNKLLYKDSLSPKTDHKEDVDKFFLKRDGLGQTMEINWFSRVGNVKELTDKYKNLQYDKENGFSLKERTTDDVFNIGQTLGVGASTDVEGVVGVSESIYVPIKYKEPENQ